MPVRGAVARTARHDAVRSGGMALRKSADAAFTASVSAFSDAFRPSRRESRHAHD